MLEGTLCHVVTQGRLLLKKATRGISQGKWNAPGGQIEIGETPEENAVREVFEETGVKARDLFHHGTLRYFMDGGGELSIKVHLFSTQNFSGEPKSTSEGAVRWFRLEALPFDEMWDDDRYWLQLMLDRKRFDADFYYDAKNEKVAKHRITLK